MGRGYEVAAYFNIKHLDYNTKMTIPHVFHNNDNKYFQEPR